MNYQLEANTVLNLRDQDQGHTTILTATNVVGATAKLQVKNGGDPNWSTIAELAPTADGVIQHEYRCISTNTRLEFSAPSAAGSPFYVTTVTAAESTF